jgi:2-succinyl-6-hydroxy-2,4-cyclohexadiene-1-carboxylate synthase
MGGRVALATALNHPQAVSSLTLISATAGIENPEDRTLRREADHSLADRIERIGIQAFTEEWLAGPLFSTLPRTASRAVPQ